MKNTALSTAIATTAAALAIGFAGAPAASAEVATTTLGSAAALVDGGVTQSWTVTGLRPSSDVIPYPVQGRLWEATATGTAIAGDVQPVVSNFNARANNGDTYRVLFEVATPQGVNPAVLAPGQQTSGRLYFDVTGADPDSVVYNSLGTDLLLWVQPPPTTPGSGWTPGAPATTPAGTGSAEAPEGAPAPEAVPGSSTGTPIVEGGSQGTPIDGTGTTTAESATPGQNTGTAAAPNQSPTGSTDSTPATTGAAATGTGSDQTAATPPGSQGTPVTETPATSATG